MAPHLWRHKDNYAAQLDNRLLLRKLLDDSEDNTGLTVAIRYVSALPLAHPLHIHLPLYVSAL